MTICNVCKTARAVDTLLVNISYEFGTAPGDSDELNLCADCLKGADSDTLVDLVTTHVLFSKKPPQTPA